MQWKQNRYILGWRYKRSIKTLDKRYATTDIEDQEELQEKYESAMMGKKNPSNFIQDMGVIRRKLKKDYKIEITNKLFIIRLMNRINNKPYALDKTLMRKEEEKDNLTPKL